MIPALSLAAVVLLLCECHKARQRAHRWQQEARAAQLALDAVEAEREALALGLLADSFMELGPLSHYSREEWDW